eukprot:SAG31_NODE_34372_length_333_cov_1.555556_1_plen_85_part_10
MKGLAAVDLGISEARAAKLIKTFDRAGDGHLAYHEFVRMLSSTRAESHAASVCCSDLPFVATPDCVVCVWCTIQLRNAISHFRRP